MINFSNLEIDLNNNRNKFYKTPSLSYNFVLFYIATMVIGITITQVVSMIHSIHVPMCSLYATN